MSIGHPISEIWLFQNLTLKIQGQGHGWGQSWKSQSGCNILSTHIPFVPCQSAIPFLRYSIFKVWPWKSKVKVMDEVDIESHNMGPTFYWLTSLSFHVNRPSHSWDTAFSKFDLENPRSRSCMGEGNVESHKVSVTSYRLACLSFHVNLPFHSWDTVFSKFDLENPRSRSWVRWTLKVSTWVQHSIDSHPFHSMSISHPIPEIRLFKKFDLENPRSRSWVRWTLKVSKWVQHPIDSHAFRSMSIGPSIPEIRHFQNLTWKSKVKVKWPWCCTTTGLDNSIEPQMV